MVHRARPSEPVRFPVPLPCLQAQESLFNDLVEDANFAFVGPMGPTRVAQGHSLNSRTEEVTARSGLYGVAGR